MKIYKVPFIRKPFTENDPEGKYRLGDIGVYDYYIKKAKKLGAILEISTPKGTMYADPNNVMDNCEHIYRYFEQERPMRLFIIEPDYGNKSQFFKPEVDETWEGKLAKHLAIGRALGKINSSQPSFA